MKTILIVGGYGQFGSRLCQRLCHIDNIVVLVAGRNFEKAESLCERFSGNLKPELFDRDNDIAKQLRAINPTIVVDAAGPFQSAFNTGYELPQQCAALGAHYIDLSDSGEFTKGIASLDKAAKDGKVTIISGASSVPALSAAVVDDVQSRIKIIKSIEGGISPGGKIDIGISVTKAVLSYLGKPLKVFRGGTWASENGFSRQHKLIVRINGEKPVARKYGLCDAPDLLVFPDLYAGVDTVRFYGSTELRLIHNTLRFLAWAQSHGWIKNLEKNARLFAWVGSQLGRFASERGCMYMDIKGFDDNGRSVKQRWNLIASDGDGPFIPILATEILIKRWLVSSPKSGARSAAGEIALSEFQKLFSDLSIKSEFGGIKPVVPIFQLALGNEFEKLDEKIRDGHSVTSFKTLTGHVDTQRGLSLVPNLIANLFRFPKTTSNSPITVTMDVRGKKEIWTRKIGNSAFKSILSCSDNSGQIIEQFGPIKFTVSLKYEDEKLVYRIVSARLFGIKLPNFILPKSNTYEQQQHGKFAFNVDIILPFFGRIIKYTGTLS